MPTLAPTSGTTTRTSFAITRRATTATAIVCFGFSCDRLLIPTEHLAFEHPHFDPDDAVSRLGFGNAIVDVGTQGVQRHASFTIPLGTCDLGAVQAPRAHDLDTLGTKAHRILHRTLHRTTEHDPLLKLLGDRIGNQLGIDFRLAHFLDVHMDRHTHDLLQITLERLDILALLTDHYTRAGAVKGNPSVLRRAFDDYARHRSVR